ncbi:UNVERIFIED_ORG: enamine deaminase RidA (YjgF/YER057c/UK114 family) [Gordonia westfalica J30]
MSRQLVASGSAMEEEFAYSRVVAQGGWIFVSGTTGFDYSSMTVAEGVAEQAAQCFRNVVAALSTVQATIDDVVRVTYYLPDRSDFAACAPIIRKYFGRCRPVATMVEAGLIDPRLRIEIEVTALRR